MKPLHLRVRAAMEKRDREEKRKSQRAEEAKQRKLFRAEMAREDRIEDLIAGKVSPRDLQEMGIVMRAEGWDE